MTEQNSPADKEKACSTPGYIPIRQGPLINAFAALTTHGGNALTQEADRYTDNTTIKRGGMIVTIRQTAAGVLSNEGRRLTCYDTMLFDMILAEFAARPNSGGEVALPLEDIAALRGVNNMKELRGMITISIDTLENTTINYTRPGKTRKGKQKGAYDVQLLERGATIKNSVLKVTLPAALRGQARQVMPFPGALMGIDLRYNPNTYYFGHKLAVHKHMNAGKANADTIGVDTLIKETPVLPTYAAVRAGSRHITRQIIKPFFRDMDKLTDVQILSKWELYHRSGERVTAEELKGMKYKTFIRLLVKVTWANYPDQTARLQRIAEYKAAAKQRKAKRAARRLAKLEAKAQEGKAAGQAQNMPRAQADAQECSADSA